jgi:transposase-like protein
MSGVMHSFEDRSIARRLHVVATYFENSSAISEMASTLEVVDTAYHSWMGDEFS